MKTYRNDDLIFNKIGYWFSANMLFNALWLTIFTKYNLTAFFVAAADIVALLVTAFVMMMMISRAHQKNFFEIIAYVAFSMYSGWVTVATILNFSFCIQGLGFRIGVDAAEIILWGALIIFMTVCLFEQNPVYGAVYLWAVKAIQVR